MSIVWSHKKSLNTLIFNLFILWLKSLQLLSNVLLFAAADKIAKLFIILLAKGPLLYHEVTCLACVLILELFVVKD